MSSRSSYLEWKEKRSKNPGQSKADQAEQLRAKISLCFDPKKKAILQKELEEL